MAKERRIEERRQAVRSIHKITRTMELISTARFRRAMDRVTAADAYTNRIMALVGHVARIGLQVQHPLFEPREKTTHATLLVLSANRGMCGGYNAAVLRVATARWDELRSQVPESRLEVSGKRGISAFRFRGIQADERYTHFKDRPTFEEVEQLANRYLDDYRAGRLDRLDVAYTKFESLSRQQAVLETLLPLTELEEVADDAGPGPEVEYEFLPSVGSILDELIPASFKLKLFKCFLDAAVSEQIARMLAMKAAAENAEAMIEHLTMTYNRARQGQITAELLEVVAGAEALRK